MTKRRGKGGFTLVELAVTLVILSILFAIAVPNLLGYIHLSQFRRNESCAKTMYLSAESALTYCRTGGEWESFCRRVKDEGVLNRSFDEADGEQKKLSGRIYGIRLDADEYASGELSGDGSLVDELLSQDTYDKSLLNAAICIEIDVESGHVYSVFYGTSCKGLYYGSNALSQPAELSGEWLDMDSRASYDLRRAERLGYYSVQDAVNVVNLDAAKLKITSINLVNGETLSLGWSSSVRAQNRANVYYEVKLYSSTDKAQLLTIRVPGSALKTGAQPLEVTTENGTTKNYTFPLEYDQTAGRASLVLDGMMNAQLYSRLDELSAEDEAAFRQSSSTSITRFGGTLAAPAEVYATVQAFPDPNAAYDSGEMYQKSDVIDSNRANTLFGDGTSADGTECEVKAFRHLSNIRYMNKAAEFSVAARSLDWTSDSVRVYGTAAHGALTVSSGTDIGFPSIPELKTGQTLNGAGGLLNRITAVFTGGNAVSSLRLDETSIDARAEYLGLFQKNSGTIRGLRLLSPQVDVSSATLKGVGAVCGYSCGSLEGDSVDGEDARVRAALTAANAEGIGGVAGVIEGNGRTTGLSASGAVTGTLPVSGEARGIGGIAGENGGEIVLSGAKAGARRVTGSGSGVGGVIGVNAATGTLRAADDSAQGDVIAADSELTVRGGSKVGGIAGINRGTLGGIAGENLGRIQNCAVGSGGAAVTLTTRSRTAAGAVCAVNHKGGTVSGAEIGDRITISGSAFLLGALVGDNSGTVADAEVAQQPEYDVSASALQVGGAVGINRPGGTVRSVRVSSDFKGFSRYQYLGGVVGQNCAPSSDGTAAGKVENCTYSGAITEGKSAAANCYGGIAGVNGGLLSGNTVSALTLTADGVYTATATSSASDKERLSTHIGGIAGKNDTSGIIEQCYIDNTRTGSITVKNGMVGGVTGYNKGTVALSGDKSTETLMANVREVSELLANAKSLSADSSWVKWNDGADIEELTYASSGKPVAQGRTMQIIVTGNGSLGGIAGCNAPSGALERCVSGNWLLVNRSDSISVGTGGIIGMNESEKNLSFLLNRAFVGRQLRSANTNRFAGGIIGTQTNRTTADWLIEGCINYGTVYGCLSHYSGGIIGQWTNNGGTLERCYNYGNLQTTFKANWVGASGGIVAQLYHASSGQDFNILSCQNHGSLYGRNGRSVADCANDSGGILGNVTAYAADAGKGQVFTINVADCVNGPGVEIYSGSMASGIVGFFSADGVANITVNSRAQQLITNATENITLNIDRCRNYAKTLSGYNFTAGIFGDRYAYGRTQPATDTYIQNCFSVTPGQKDREIVFMHSGGSDTLSAEKTGNNYYFDDAWGITNQYASGGIDSGYARSESRRAYSRMLGYGLFDHRLFAAVAGPTLTPVDSFATTSHGMYYNMTPSNTSIDGHGIMTETSSGKIVGRVIYDMPYSYEPYVFNHGGAKLQQAVKTRNGGASGMDAYARTAYRDFEHGRTDGALDGSFGVSLRQNSEGGFEVSITDDDRPLYYEGRVSVDGREVLSGLRFVPKCKGQGLWDPELNGTQAYGAGTTEGTFQLPAGLENDTAGQSITLSVRAVSLFEDTAPSAWKQAQTVDVSVLPTPDISIRLTGHENASRSNGWKDSAVYRLSLNNLADYARFSGWKVVCRLGSQTVTLDKSRPAAEIRGGGLQELIVTASADVTNGIQPASVTRTIPIDTPAYRPDGSISSLTASYSGSTAADFTVTAALTVRETTMETPPVYRIELLGTVGGQEYVFAHEDVLTSAGSTVTANFRDLPVQYFADTVKNRRVRAWYAASGLGPVITYGETRQSGDAAVTLRTYSASGEQQPDRTIYSHVLGSPKDFADYIASTALQITPLAAPVLNAPELSRSASGSISYRFSWTQPGQGAAKARYSVRLTGITADRARVGIPLGEVYTDSAAKEFTVSADDWQYAAVELTVTRLGQAYGEVGLSASQTCDVKQRLPRPGQPSVSNPDTNELVYDIRWRASGSETGCAGYRIYVQPKGGQAEPLGDLVPAGGGVYSVKRSLEQYAGKTVDLYLVAAADDTGYANSPNGIIYTMTVPERLSAPRVKWAYSWLGDASSDPVAASDFRNGGLTVTVTPQDAASMPPGGSTCLLRAVIYDENHRELGTYPVSAMRESGGSYVCALSGLDTKYAGRSIRFETRISQSAGQVSSAWVEGDTVTLPRVRLDTPAASLANVNETVRVTYGQANLMIYQADWTALLTTLSWREVENADRYTITLTDQSQQSALVSVDMSGGQPLITVAGQTPAAESGGWYNIKPGSTVTGRYSLTGGSIRYYSCQLNTMLRAEDGVFTLKLPNLFSMTTHDNQTLSLSDVQIRQISVTADSTSTRYAASDAAEREFS